MDAAAKYELQKAKDRRRRQAYRDRRCIERKNLQQEVEKLTEELRNAQGHENMLASAWRMLAERQLAARMAAEAEQRRLCEAASSRAVLLEQFQDLMNQRIDESDDFIILQHKRIRLELTDDAIFSAYIDELDGVYTQTDEALRSRQLYKGVDDPDNTVAFKFRITTRLASGKIASVLQRVAIRRYEKNERMVIIWRLFTEGEGAFFGSSA
ncbi:hypothetical protein GQ600_11957 [Phytophthora cactorum]|nr:hypothetical protein GQ600_11957 [Phytophthora cactorum]